MPFVGSSIFGVRINCWLKFLLLVLIGLAAPLTVLFVLSSVMAFNIYTIIATYAVCLLVSMLVVDAYPSIFGKPEFQSKNKKTKSEREIRLEKIAAAMNKNRL